MKQVQKRYIYSAIVSSIFFIVSGISALFRSEQNSKAPSPILVTVFGISTSVNKLFENAPSFISVTVLLSRVDGIGTTVPQYLSYPVIMMLLFDYSLLKHRSSIVTSFSVKSPVTFIFIDAKIFAHSVGVKFASSTFPTNTLSPIHIYSL